MKKLEKKIKDEILEFCGPRALDIIKSIRPKILMIIGIPMFKKIAIGEMIMESKRMRTSRELLMRGVLRDSPEILTYGVRHLSGALSSLRSDEVEDIQRYFTQELGVPLV